jgi:hypothetical protein
MISSISVESSRACGAYVSGRPLSRPPARENGGLHVASRLRLDLKQAASLLFLRLVRREACVLCLVRLVGCCAAGAPPSRVFVSLLVRGGAALYRRPSKQSCGSS